MLVGLCLFRKVQFSNLGMFPFLSPYHAISKTFFSGTGFYFSYGGYGCYSVHITLGSQERYSKNSRSGSGLDPVQDHRGQALHQGQRDPAEEVVQGGPLLLARLHILGSRVL